MSHTSLVKVYVRPHEGEGDAKHRTTNFQSQRSTMEMRFHTSCLCDLPSTMAVNIGFRPARSNPNSTGSPRSSTRTTQAPSSLYIKLPSLSAREVCGGTSWLHALKTNESRPRSTPSKTETKPTSLEEETFTNTRIYYENQNTLQL